MRRTTGQIRERSPGSFELRYELGTNPATGRRRIATATVRGTRRDAEKELRRLLRLLDTGEHVDPNWFNVGECSKAGWARSAGRSRPERRSAIPRSPTISSPSTRQSATVKARPGTHSRRLQCLGCRWPTQRQSRRPLAADPATYPSYPRRRARPRRRAATRRPQPM